MFYFFIGIVIFIMLLSIIVHSSKTASQKRKNERFEKIITTTHYTSDLDLLTHATAQNTFFIERMMQVQHAYAQQLHQPSKARFMSEDSARLPSQKLLKSNDKNQEFSLLEAEFQRFLFLSTLFKNVPMFSQHVDELWHTTIMFTNQYQTFSETLLGPHQLIHHAPNIEPTNNPKERAFFDLIYSSFFAINDYSYLTWGSFFSYTIDKQVLIDFGQQRAFSTEELLRLQQQYLRDELSLEQVRYVAERLQQIIYPAWNEASSDIKNHQKIVDTAFSYNLLTAKNSNSYNMNGVLFFVLLASLLTEEELVQTALQSLGLMKVTATASGTDSSYIAPTDYYDNDTNHHDTIHHSNHDSNHHSCGSSCGSDGGSSCGSGCSSS